MAFRFGKHPKPEAAAKSVFRAAVQSDGTFEMMVYGEIIDSTTLSLLESYGYETDGFVSAIAVKKQLETAGPYTKIRVRINSPGGDAFEGVAIHNLLRAQGKPIETCVDGIAASAASIIAMAGSVRSMGHNAMLMIHNAWGGCVGNAADMRKMGDTLDKISESIAQTYVDRTGKSLDQVKAMMDDETWLSADDCMKNGFATAIAADPDEPALAMARNFKALAKLRHVPENLRPATPASKPEASQPAVNAAQAENENGCDCDCANCQSGDCADCTDEGCEDPNCVDCPMQNDDLDNSTVVPSNVNLFEAEQWMLEKGI